MQENLTRFVFEPNSSDLYVENLERKLTLARDGVYREDIKSNMASYKIMKEEFARHEILLYKQSFRINPIEVNVL